MNIIGIIPSRYASTRLPAKPLVDICGKPMVQRVYEQAQRSTLLTHVVVATDDERIVAAVTAFGGNVAMTPVDIQSGSDRIALVAKNFNADIVVNIQGDEPLIDPQLIDQTIRALIEDPSAVVSTAVKRTTSHQDVVNPSVVKVVLDANSYALYFSRSPIPYVRDARTDEEWVSNTGFYKHFGIYVYRAEFLQKYTTLKQTPLEIAEKLEQLRILENEYKIRCVITEYESLPVDTPEDLQKVINYLNTQ
ncbi:MAG: 3-deoxy-manno-octulosonate cytidylyltransferase [Bacteriovoracaceae bacterium]|nr:3-deoxy-manno-octulosonate cytidylyltransferase [Bacteroidota bacterium]